MELLKAFQTYEAQFPDRQSCTKRIFLALRRDGIQTLEQLWALHRDHPAKLAAMRSIGPKSMKFVSDVLSFYELQYPAPPLFESEAPGIRSVWSVYPVG